MWHLHMSDPLDINNKEIAGIKKKKRKRQVTSVTLSKELKELNPFSKLVTVGPRGGIIKTFNW